MARLYSPLLQFDDTFCLQEYFVPKRTFALYFIDLKKCVQNVQKESLITLLNITIRFVKEDTYSALPYAQSDCYAFVLYYRLRRTREADEILSKHHKKIAEITLSNGGTFYLPYRHHYDEELLRAYPQWTEFVRKKYEHDPFNLFTNTWFERYKSEAKVPFQIQKKIDPLKTKDQTKDQTKEGEIDQTIDQTKEEEIDILGVSKHRKSSFRELMNNGALREKFKRDFLVDTFNIVSEKVLMNLLSQCCYDTRNEDDFDIYQVNLSLSLSISLCLYLFVSKIISILFCVFHSHLIFLLRIFNRKSRKLRKVLWDSFHFFSRA